MMDCPFFPTSPFIESNMSKNFLFLNHHPSSYSYLTIKTLFLKIKFLYSNFIEKIHIYMFELCSSNNCSLMSIERNLNIKQYTILESIIDLLLKRNSTKALKLNRYIWKRISFENRSI